MPEIDAFYLPHWPPALPALARIALLLLAAAVAGELVQRWLRIPRIVGQVGAGIALGPQALGFVGGGALAELDPLVDLALGLLLFELGSRIDFLWLKRNPWLLAQSALEAALCFAGTFALLRLADVGPLVSALIAAILMTASPEVVIRITQDASAQGQVTERLRLLTALSCAYAVFVLAVMLAWLNARYADDAFAIVLHPVYLISASIVLAAVATGLVHGVLRVIGRGAGADAIALVGSVAMLVAVAEALAASTLISLLAFGALLHNSMSERRALPRVLEPLGGVLTLILFTATGAMLVFAPDPRVWSLALALVAVRLLSKGAATTALAQPSGIGWRKGLWLGVGLAPLSALAVVMLDRTMRQYPQLPDLFPALALACVALMQLIGPALTQLCLRQTGEIGEDRR